MAMSDRLAILKEADSLITKYTRTDNWRPGLLDVYVYSLLQDMYESDYDNPVPHFIWIKSVDEVMQHIINSSHIFDLEYGWDQLSDDIRDYLANNDFTIDPMDNSTETN